MPRIGDRLSGRYELVEPIANGGMAQVWRATDTVLGRPVAVKLLHPHLAGDRGFVIRFRREAVAAARLSHRSIVAIYDTVNADGVEAIVMELLEGRTLRAVLDDVHHLSPADVVDLGMQISDALDEAHSGGVIHRDIKPSNIMLCADRRIMVTDFGIAKAGEDTDLTVTGTLLGTAKYLAPEQVAGDPIDPRADLYSLGVVLFESATGRPPFKADTDAATALARLHVEPPRIRHLDPELPQALDDVIFKLMSRDPADRHARAVDARAALSGVHVDPTVADGTLLVAEPLMSAPVAVADATHGGLSNDDLVDEAFDESDEDDSDFGEFIRSERSWIGAAMVVLLVGGALVLAGLLFNQSPIGSSFFDQLGGESNDDVAGSNDGDSDGEGGVDTETTGTTPLTDFDEVVETAIVGARSIDPQGDGVERPDDVALAYDGDTATSWRTESYRFPNYGNGLKDGVGYEVDLGGTAVVREIVMTTPTEGWSVEIFVGDDFSAPPGQWGEPAASGTNLDGNQAFELDDVRGRRVMLWFTDHGLSPDRGDEGDEPDHRFELAELTVS